jgi:6-pyruvoyltetrahydropterin/6-carboxytetrahydropterin synthase
MYAIEVTSVFAAAHQLKLPDGQLEPLHGHNWEVTVRIASPRLDAMDTVMDFHQLERTLESVVGGWRNRHLNEVPPFSGGVNPSAERVAEVIATAVAPHVPAPAQVAEVRVTEAPGCVAIHEVL